MKTHDLLFFLVLMMLSACRLDAQDSPTNSGSPSTSDSSSVHLSSAELQQLVGPIALYSDPLVALILPASTYPDEITQADNYLNGGGSPDGIASQNWDKSVQGVAHYPDVLHMMASNLDWTHQLGAAVLNQQSDVMAAIQSMRVKAKNLGNLVTTPQQTVTTENNTIEITPANPQTVYVPSYDPAVVYVQPAPVGAAPWISFGVGFALGAWADYGVHWGVGGGFVCSGGFYNSSFGWSSSYHSWSSSHYSWHHDWHHGGPHPPYHPGHGGHMPPFNHHNNDHWHGNDHGHDGDHGHDNNHGHNNDHGHDNDHGHRNENAHRHNSKENHDRHEHHASHHAAHHSGGHHGGGHKR